MHLGNGALTPECCLITWGAAATGLGIAATALRHEKITIDRALAAGGLTAAVFAAQMFNVQVLPQAVSGHFLGGALLCWTLGPAWGSTLMSLVLLVQALVLGDGGLSAWGANVINMALLPAGLTWLARRSLAADSSKLTEGLTLAGISAGAVVGAALLVVLEVAIGRFDLLGEIGAFGGAMVVNHLVIAIAEAGLTVGLIALLQAAELTSLPSSISAERLRAAGAMLLAMGLVALAISFGSPLPDGFEAASGALGNALTIQSAGSIASIEESQAAISALFSNVLAGDWGVAIAATLFVAIVAPLLSLVRMPRDEASAA